MNPDPHFRPPKAAPTRAAFSSFVETDRSDRGWPPGAERDRPAVRE